MRDFIANGFYFIDLWLLVSLVIGVPLQIWANWPMRKRKNRAS